jgi:hypothetical protein
MFVFGYQDAEVSWFRCQSDFVEKKEILTTRANSGTNRKDIAHLTKVL